MAITAKELGRRLKQAREACGMTQEMVARKLGMSRSTLAQMELGNRAVTSLELSKLAYLYGRDIGSFLREDFEGEDVLSVLFRAELDIAEKEETADALRKSLAVGRELRNLELLLGLSKEPRVPIYPLAPPKNKWEAISQGEKVALEERRRIGLGDAPISDVAEVLESQGIATVQLDLPEDVSGLTLRSPDIDIMVVVNSAHHYYRRRFSFAHEYAHVLLDRDLMKIVSRSSRREELLEVRANAFAAAFLMPEEGVKEFLGYRGKGAPSRASKEIFDEEDVTKVQKRRPPREIHIYDIVELAHHFKVSRIAALYRIRNMRPPLITDDRLNYLKELEEHGRGRELADLLRLEEPDHEDLRLRFRRYFLSLAFETYGGGLITYSKLLELAEMVEVPPETVSRIVKELGIGSDDGLEVLVPGE